jgi:staphylococcal nuclease domain-containing protein 1
VSWSITSELTVTDGSNLESKLTHRFLRKKLIGKPVHVLIDYVKPKDGEYEERECVTITYGGNSINVAEQLIDKGLATVLRHRRDDEDRSAEYDKLIIAEQTATTETRGVHSPKDVPAQQRIVDASENTSRASQYLPSWKRTGKLSAVVDFVSGGHRFKLLLPKEHAKITFVLAGVKAPRTARTAHEKSEPYGPEAHRFASKYMQRDVEVAFGSTDKMGGFIGAMYAGGQNVAVELVRAGLATVHEYSVQSLPFAAELLAAEEQAKKERKNVSLLAAYAKLTSDLVRLLWRGGRCCHCRGHFGCSSSPVP